MVKLETLTRKDVRLANSLATVLTLLDLTTEDLVKLKQIKKLEREYEELLVKVNTLREDFETYKNNKYKDDVGRYFESQEGETLINE